MTRPIQIDLGSFLFTAQAIVGLECRVGINGDYTNATCVVFSQADPQRTYSFEFAARTGDFAHWALDQLTRAKAHVLMLDPV